MEGFENKLKLGITTEGRLDVLRGREGEIFPSVVFHAEETPKGKKVYKSSSPSRKIITLSPMSQEPIAGKAYRVLIISDSKPKNDLDGKMVGYLIDDSLSWSAARELAIELRDMSAQVREQNKDMLERVRIKKLIERCAAVRIDREPPAHMEEIPPEQYHRFLFRTKKAAELQNKRVRARNAASDEVIRLRLQLQAEGKAIIDYASREIKAASEKMDAHYLTNLMDCVRFAASPSDAPRILELLDAPALRWYGSITARRIALETIMRFENPDVTVKLVEYVDRLFHRGELDRYTVGTMIAHHIYKIQTRARTLEERTAQSEIMRRLTMVVGPDVISAAVKELYFDDSIEDLFMSVEMREKLKTFRYNIEDLDLAHPGSFDAAMRYIRNLREVLVAHGRDDIFPRVMQRVYWYCLSRYCNSDRFTSEIEVLIPKLETETRVPVDVEVLRPYIQNLYDLLTLDLNKSSRRSLRLLSKYTHESWLRSRSEMQQFYWDVISNSQYTREDQADRLQVLQEISGIAMDARSLTPKIQQEYEKIFSTAATHHSTYYTPGIQSAQELFALTKVRPEIHPDTMRNMYALWLKNKWDPRMIVDAVEITGIPFTNAQQCESDIQKCYAQYLPDSQSGIVGAIPLQALIDLERVTGIKPRIDPGIVQGIYMRALVADREHTLQELIGFLGVPPDYESQRAEIENYYASELAKIANNSWGAALKNIERVYVATKIPLVISSHTTLNGMGDVFFRQLQHLTSPESSFEEAMARLTAFQSPDLWSKLLSSALATAIDYEHSDTLRKVISRIEQKQIAVDGDFVLHKLHAKLPQHPEGVFRRLTLMRSAMGSISGEVQVQFEKTFSDPWMRALVRLEKVQAISSNADNNPWDQELQPLLESAFEHRIITLDDPRDAEFLVSFIEAVGMYNLKNLFALYIQLRRNENPAMLPEWIRGLCEDFGIRLYRNDGSPRFQASLEIFNEIAKSLGLMQAQLLHDEVPNQLLSKLGSESFDRIKGETQFGRNHSLAEVVHRWQATLAKHPEVGRLPIGFRESELRVPVQKSERPPLTSQGERDLQAFFSSQEVADVCQPLLSAWDVAGKNYARDWFDTRLDSLKLEAKELSSLLDRTPDDLERAAQYAPTDAQRTKLRSAAKALRTPRGRQGYEKKRLAVRDAWEAIDQIRKDFVHAAPYNAYPMALERLAELHSRFPMARELREFSALHMFDIMPDEMRYVVTGMSSSLDEDTVRDLNKLSKQYVEEHYLHYVQHEDHTQHKPFSDRLLDALTLAWQQTLDVQTGHLPITKLVKKMDRVLGISSESTTKTIPVAMIPVSGLLNIYSGDLGDSCHTERHFELADGQHKSLRSWIFVTGRQTSRERCRGSVLAIQARTRPEEQPARQTEVLVVRANNPVENLIQSVDADQFVIATLREAVETARRMWHERRASGASLPLAQQRQCVAIPMDQRGMASTNRQSVSDVYRRRFVDCPRIGLQSTPETNFNTYPIWDHFGRVPCVKIWEIDEDGREQWHGTWPTSQS